jgi:hypothetical protein
MKRLKIIHYILTFTLSLLAFAASADGVTGSVFEKQKDGKKLPLAGVNVYWAGTTKGTFTDTGGKFSLSSACSATGRTPWPSIPTKRNWKSNSGPTKPNWARSRSPASRTIPSFPS